MNSQLLDGLVADVAGHFGLSIDRTRQLLGVLIVLIFDEKRGGFSGFSQLFRQKGIGYLVESWVSDGPNKPISPTQVESLFGQPLIGAIARKLGVAQSVTSNAISGLLPELVNEITVGNKEPTSIPEILKDWVANTADWLGDLRNFGWGALATAGAAVIGGVRAGDRAVDKATHKTGNAWLPWLVFAVLLLITFLLFKSCKKEATEIAPAANTAVNNESAAPIAQNHSRFTFESLGGKATVSGQVASDAEKMKLREALRATFGAGNVDGDITVETNTAPASWIDKVIALLPDLKVKGVKLGLEGDKIRIDTSALPEAERFALSSKLRHAFGDFEISGLWDKALVALASLKSGFSTNELVKALNLSSINFGSDSISITRDSYEILGKAAEAIKAAPVETKIEVAGHTDNTGDAAHNLQRSLDRANAVTAKLVEMGVDGTMLVGKGYGQDKPIADNATEDGRAQNRRIEFTVLK